MLVRLVRLFSSCRTRKHVKNLQTQQFTNWCHTGRHHFVACCVHFTLVFPMLFFSPQIQVDGVSPHHGSLGFMTPRVIHRGPSLWLLGAVQYSGHDVVLACVSIGWAVHRGTTRTLTPFSRLRPYSAHAPHPRTRTNPLAQRRPLTPASNPSDHRAPIRKHETTRKLRPHASPAQSAVVA